MSLMGGVKEKIKRIKGAEWAILLLVLGLAGSLLLAPASNILGYGTQPTQEKSTDELEARLARVLSSMEGAGKVDVVIYSEDQALSAGNWLDKPSQQQSAKPIGVVVVAEGADNIALRLEIARAVQTLLQLDADAVEIFKMKADVEGNNP